MDTARQRARRVILPVVKATALIAVALLMAALLTGLLAGPSGRAAAGRPTTAAGSALTSLTLTSVGPDGQPDAPSTQAALAAGGQYAAFQFRPAQQAAEPGPTASARGGRKFVIDGLDQPSSIYLRDLSGATTTRLSDPADGNATGPTISADGRLVGYEQGGNVYVADRQATTDDPVVRRVTGTSRDLPDEHAVACPARLGAGRVTPCGPKLSADGSTLVYPAEQTPVSPQLSVTARLDEEEGGPEGGSGQSDDAVAHRVPPGDLLDLTPYYPGEPYGSPDATALVRYRNIGVTPARISGLTVTEPPGFGSGQPFELSESTCTGVLAPRHSCSATVSYLDDDCPDSNSDAALVAGTLTTHSPVPAGQSGLELTGLCSPALTDAQRVPAGPPGATATAYRTVPLADRAVTLADRAVTLADRTATAHPAEAGCPAPPRGLALTAAPAVTSDVEDAPLIDAGPAETGRPYVIWTPVSVPAQADGSANVDFAAANGDDCGIRLVNPAKLKLADPLPAIAPPPCRQGEQLTGAGTPPTSPPPSTPTAPPAATPPTSSGTASAQTTAAGPPSVCTAYLLISPGAVAPDAAFLGTTYGSYYDLSIAPAAYVTAQGVRHVIVARRDPGGAGNFAASPSTVVSVTSQGAELPGATEPAVSADGRYVGFAAPAPIGRRGAQVASRASQVWWRDTEAAGGGQAGQPGVTTLVSCLPRRRAGPCLAAANADSPSLAGDGQQVAFATTAAVRPHNGFVVPPSGEPAAGGPESRGNPVSPDQVYVRGVTTKASVLVSGAQPFSKPNQDADETDQIGGNGSSYAPAMTEDGTTVGFVSRATDLTGARVAAGAANLYLRAAGGGRDSGAASELVSGDGASLPAGTAVGGPSVDAIGRLVTFAASGALAPGAPAGVASVYTFDRRPRLSGSPGAVGFGRVLVDSGTRAVTVTVTDTGPGPGTVTGVTATGPFLVSGDRCAGARLAAGSRCTVRVTFTPAAVGPAAGGLVVTTQDDGQPPVSGGATVSATVPTPRLTTTPGLASYGETTQVRGAWFAPGRKVKLTWSPGLGSVVATASGSGSFTAYMVIFPNDVIGPRMLRANGGAGVRASAQFLVQQGSTEPPFSSSGQPGGSPAP
jgi:hypothetical protein